jgi:hypothetical protein
LAKDVPPTPEFASLYVYTVIIDTKAMKNNAIAAILNRFVIISLLRTVCCKNQVATLITPVIVIDKHDEHDKNAKLALFKT